jgi:transposase
VQPEVEEIPDAEHELLVARVAAIDVAKAAGKVAVRLPGRAGRRVSRVWDVAATSGAVTDLAEHLVGQGIEKVTVESTSDYWRIWYYLLEAAGLDVQLVNAREVKNVPGRAKTDKLDAVWLAKLTEKGLLRPSFVPPAPIRRLRDYTRLRTDLTHDRSRQVQRLEKLLEDALIKISAVATDIMGVSGRAMIEALIAGQRDPTVLAGLARGRMKTKHSALVAALDGRFDDHPAELARMLLDQIDALTTQIDTLAARIDQLLAAMPDTQPVDPRPAGPTPGQSIGTVSDTALGAVDRLDEIPGIGPNAAQVILAEIGLDMSRFPTPAHLVSWAKLSTHHPVRTAHPWRQDRQGQPLPQGHARRRRRRGRQDQHLPRRTLPAHRQTPRQAQGPGRGCPLHSCHRVAPLDRLRRPLPRPRIRLPHPPHRPRTPDAQPHRPTHRHGLPSHPRTRRIT